MFRLFQWPIPLWVSLINMYWIQSTSPIIISSFFVISIPPYTFFINVHIYSIYIYIHQWLHCNRYTIIVLCYIYIYYVCKYIYIYIHIIIPPIYVPLHSPRESHPGDPRSRRHRTMHEWRAVLLSDFQRRWADPERCLWWYIWFMYDIISDICGSIMIHLV